MITAAAMLAPAGLLLASVPAQASVHNTVNNYLDQFAAIANPGAKFKTLEIAASHSTLPEFNLPSLPSIAIAELPEPSVEVRARKFFCAEYARVRSGLVMFGDAKYWWGRAKNLYTRASTPVENAVMVFKTTSRLKLGHVAVVTHIVSSREIRVDQANWQNHGEIDHSTPIRDVSPKNDWSQVRVWDLKSGQYGRVYPITGFIFPQLVRQASNS